MELISNEVVHPTYRKLNRRRPHRLASTFSSLTLPSKTDSDSISAVSIDSVRSRQSETSDIEQALSSRQHHGLSTESLLLKESEELESRQFRSVVDRDVRFSLSLSPSPLFILSYVLLFNEKNSIVRFVVFPQALLILLELREKLSDTNSAVVEHFGTYIHILSYLRGCISFDLFVSDIRQCDGTHFSSVQVDFSRHIACFVSFFVFFPFYMLCRRSSTNDRSSRSSLGVLRDRFRFATTGETTPATSDERVKQFYHSMSYCYSHVPV